MITILIGISGSGKSTYANKLRQRICSTDRYIDTYAKALNVSYDESFDQIQLIGLFSELNDKFYADIDEAIRLGEDFIIDRTNLTGGARRHLIGKVRSISEKYNSPIIIKGVVFDINKDKIMEQLKKREAEEDKKIPEDVMVQQFNAFEYPLIEEGFDIIQKHSLKEE